MPAIAARELAVDTTAERGANDSGAAGERPQRLLLDDDERRVLGVLLEKGLTTPQAYPLSVNALVDGCNQKSNRDPLTDYDDERVEEILHRLQAKRLVTEVHPSTGRVLRWRQELGRTFDLRAVDLAVIAELFLRGAQSEGDLRQRASRMRDIPSLDELHVVIAKLRDHVPPFVARLTPDGIQRGVRYTHACQPEAAVRAQQAAAGTQAASGAAAGAAGSAALLARIEALEARVRRLEVALGGEHALDR